MDEKEKKKRLQINFRLTDEEANALAIKANLSGLSITAYAKKQALDGKVVTSGIKPDEVKEIISALGHIGGNINQIAKIANQGGGIETLALVDINKNLDDLWTYIRTGKKQRKPTERIIDSSDIQKDKNAKIGILEYNSNEQVNEQIKKPTLFDDSIKEISTSSSVKQDNKSSISSTSNVPTVAKICKRCKIEMVKRQVKNGKNEGKWYWSCPNAVYGDEHEFGGWV